MPGGVDPSGTHRVIPHLVERLAEMTRRHEVHVVALRQQDHPGDWELAGARVHAVGSPARRLRALRHLAREHRRRPFDVLHGFALVPQGALVALAGRALGIPWVVEAPGGEFASLPDIGFGGWRRWPGRAWVRLACRGAGACAVPSEPVRALAASRGVDTTRVPLEISGRAWPTARGPATSSASRRVAWLGSLNEVKDPWLLVEIVSTLSARGLDVAVDVVGEDLLGGAVQRRAQDRGIGGRMTFHGFLTQTRLREVLSRAALLLVTSRHEGGPRSLLEAASLGIPTVGTPVGYVAEWSPDAAVACRGADALAAAVGGLLDDDARRAALGHRALQRLSAHDAERVASAWERLYEAARGGRGTLGRGAG
ncbi:MAG: hypothetical protein AMXMBFR53_17970 [Gemmatimonadota bacterium]